ncbi:MAG: GxxExxY protein [Bacteroidetes bacterium]|nr:GxxExxY protein [Bacteroidota bacterium]
MKATYKSNFIHADLSYKIIGCAMSVYNSLGPGHLEKVYQKALGIELRKAGLNVNEEVMCDVYYDGIKVGQSRADFLVEEKILIEIKRGSSMIPADFNQLKKYLAAKNLELGLLFRFAPEQLIYKRVVNLSGYSKVEEPNKNYQLRNTA